MGATHTPRPWIDYTAAQPEAAGAYEWRVPSIAVPGAVIVLAAHMRNRGAGYRNVLSPAFDYWDGYRVHVPSGLQWRVASAANADIKHYERKLIEVEGLEHCECIYCGKRPTLHAVQSSPRGGVVIGGDPHRLNSWWLECCAWGKTPHLDDPREIERIRRAAIARATGEQP